MKHKKKTILTVFIALFAVAIGLNACGDSPFSPKPPDNKGEPPVNSTDFGLVEVTISGIGTGQMHASAQPATPPTAASFTEPAGSGGTGDGSIQLEALSHGSFTSGFRGSGGVRYIYATFKVRNAQADQTPDNPNDVPPAYNTPRQNLTFLAVDTDASASVSETFGVSAVSTLRLFDGTELSGTTAENIAVEIIPTGQVAQNISNDIISTGADVLQVFTEDEVSAISVPTGVDVFPYGFMVRTPDVTPGSRDMPANPNTDQFDGLVTFAFKIPLQAQANMDPFEISLMVLPVDDSETRITQSLEEQTPEGLLAFKQKAAGFTTLDKITLLPGSGYSGSLPLRLICEIRTAGADGDPNATYMIQATDTASFIPNPYNNTAFRIADNATFSSDFKALICPTGIITANENTFVVQSFQTGKRFVGQAYPTPSGNVAVTPSANFFPGELVEVTLTTGIGLNTPMVVRYQVATSGGSGGFSAATGSPIATGPDPYSAALGDVDGDGDLDIITANSGSNNVSFLPGDGTGGFAPEYAASPYSAGSLPSFVTIGTNGRFVYVGNSGDIMFGSPPSISAYKIVGDGGLKEITGSPFPTDVVPRSAVVGPDGSFLYVAGGGGGGKVSVYAIGSDGSLNEITGSPYNAGSFPYSVVMTPNGSYLYVANNSGGNISGYSISGDGSLSKLTDSPFNSSSDPTALAIGPNGNYLYAANLTGDNISVYDIEADGSLSEITYSPYSAGNGPRAIAVAPNGNYLYVANKISNNVSAYSINNADGTLTEITDSPFTAGHSPRSIAVDPSSSYVYVGDWNDGTVSAYTIGGDGSLSEITGSPFSTGSLPNSVAVDPSGSVVFTANEGSNNVSAFTIGAGGTLTEVIAGDVKSSFSVGTTPRSVALGDVDGDGDLDIVTANVGSDNVSILPGDGAGGFTSGGTVTAGTDPYDITLGDVNGDGNLDIITANQGSDDVSVLTGNGDGTFDVSIAYGTGTDPQSLVLGDFDVDGDLDIITANTGSNNISALQNDGTGGFTSLGTFSGDTGPVAVAFGDVNADGVGDIITANNGSNNVSVLLMTDNGPSEAVGSPFSVGTEPQSAALGDIEGDGDLDIVTANVGSDNVSILLGDGSGGFTSAGTITAGPDPYGITLGDVNGDGALDIVTANQASDDVSVLLGN